MDPKFIKHILMQLDMDPVFRRLLLSTLIADSRKAREIIHDKLPKWGEGYGHPVRIHLDRDPIEVEERVREYCKPELIGMEKESKGSL
jgi:hypothetical protein